MLTVYDQLHFFFFQADYGILGRTVTGVQTCALPIFNDDQPIQQTCSGVDEWNCKFFVNDRENPYTTDPDKPFLWIRGRHVGGRSIMWGRQSYRWSDLDFEANLREGIAIDWPIRYQDIAPWYDYVEDFIGVTGQAEGLPQLPDGKFLPPME